MGRGWNQFQGRTKEENEAADFRTWGEPLGINGGFCLDLGGYGMGGQEAEVSAGPLVRCRLQLDPKAFTWPLSNSGLSPSSQMAWLLS